MRPSCFLVLMSSLWCYSSDIVFIRSAGDPSSEQHDMELAAQFYGLDLKVVTASSNIDSPVPIPVQHDRQWQLRLRRTPWLLIDQKALLRALHRKSGASVPLLILGVTPETDPTLLKDWSGGVAVGTKSLGSPEALHYMVGKRRWCNGTTDGPRYPISRRRYVLLCLGRQQRSKNHVGTKQSSGRSDIH